MPNSNASSRTVAYCRLFLKENRWMPLSPYAELSAKHRRTDDGTIITFDVTAIVGDDEVLQWGRESFTQQQMGEDGRVEPLDLAEGVELLEAGRLDARAKQSGATGINARLMARKVRPQQWEPTPELKQQAYDRAAIGILERTSGGKPTGVTLLRQLKLQ
jgi:hypothetical protein